MAMGILNMTDSNKKRMTAISVVRPLTECRHPIVIMGSDAALWIDAEPGEPVCRQLIFDRERCEGEWEENELYKETAGAGRFHYRLGGRPIHHSVPTKAGERSRM
jgi:hypothetical protein